MLDRLGISADEAGGGGKRRASDSDSGSGRRAAPETAEDTGGKRSADEPQSRESEPVVSAGLGPPAADDRPSVRERRESDGGSAEPAGSASGQSGDSGVRLPTSDEWLPRLRLPPSLAPIEDLGDGPATSEPSWESAGSSGSSYGEPFGSDYSSSDYSGYSSALSEEEPAADAGLAELLARALAEHRAGTSSASALVKKLGEHRTDSGDPRPVNGHRPRGESGDRGRHRGAD